MTYDARILKDGPHREKLRNALVDYNEKLSNNKRNKINKNISEGNLKSWYSDKGRLNKNGQRETRMKFEQKISEKQLIELGIKSLKKDNPKAYNKLKKIIKKFTI